MVNMCGQISRGIGHNCPPSIIQLAVAQVLDKTADLSVYETNMNLIYNCLMELGFTCVKPGGTFYIFPKALEEDAKVFCEKALKYDLVLVPADSFGCPGYFRNLPGMFRHHGTTTHGQNGIGALIDGNGIGDAVNQRLLLPDGCPDFIQFIH